MITKETVSITSSTSQRQDKKKLILQIDIINADLDRAIDMYNVRQERQMFQATTHRLETPQQDELEEAEEQHEQASDESDEINIDETEHMKTHKKLISVFEICGPFFGLETKYVHYYTL